MNHPPRVVIDANLHHSAHRPGDPAGPIYVLARAWRENRVRPLASPDVLEDTENALRKERLNLSEAAISDFFARYAEHYEMVIPPRGLKIVQCRDAKDQCYLELAYAAKADALITGDKDLHAAAGEFPIPILNAKDFMKRFLQRLPPGGIR
ncbi:MAG: putative toxin-antitoxin system toxin component, PIN family [Rhodospirillales bacterium]